MDILEMQNGWKLMRKHLPQEIKVRTIKQIQRKQKEGKSNIRIEINEIEKKQRIYKVRCWIFENVSKNEKPLAIYSRKEAGTNNPSQE